MPIESIISSTCICEVRLLLQHNVDFKFAELWTKMYIVFRRENGLRPIDERRKKKWLSKQWLVNRNVKRTFYLQS